MVEKHFNYIQLKSSRFYAIIGMSSQQKRNTTEIRGSMKKKNQNRSIIFQAILLFIAVFIIIFIGFVICNIFAIAIDCIFNGFDNFTIKLFELPYLLYILFSLIISFIFTVFIEKKSKR